MEGIRVGVVRGISYGLFRPPDEFVPQARALGAGLVRAYVYWSQVEPEPGRYVWDTVDALLAQLDGDVEVWLTVCSSSPWATRQPTDFLPPSPATELSTYTEMVFRLVEHCGGRVDYWQCDNEPSNTALLWAGTAHEYVAQLRAFHGAVGAADPAAAVVLGGCGYDVLDSAPGSEPRRFFDHLLDAGRDAFDLFDVHLYGDPARVPDFIADARSMMRAHGYEKPVVAGEHGGPVLFEYPELEPIIQEVFVEAFSAAPATQSTGELAAQAGQETPERRAMRALYDRMDRLPPRLQMFMHGCPPELEAERHRINSRELVVRTVLALESGLRRIVYWNLAPEVGGWLDPYQMMHLLFGKLVLLDYDGDKPARRFPAADAFETVADALRGVTGVRRVGPNAFRLDRDGPGPTGVRWSDGGSDLPVFFEWPG